MSNETALEQRLERGLSVSRDSYVTKTLFRIGEWFVNVVKDALRTSDLAAMPKSQFLDLVARMYDKYILPIDLPGPDIVTDPLLKQIVLKQVEQAWDNLLANQDTDPAIG